MTSLNPSAFSCSAPPRLRLQRKRTELNGDELTHHRSRVLPARVSTFARPAF